MCGELLISGFGEAGAMVIGKNLEHSAGVFHCLVRFCNGSTHIKRAGESIQPMVPGRRVMAIFSFCDVRNFTLATECLQVSWLFPFGSLFCCYIIAERVFVPGGHHGVCQLYCRSRSFGGGTIWRCVLLLLQRSVMHH